jgi:hypothetical protein
MLNAMKSISTQSILTQPAQNISHSFYCCFIVVKPKGLKVIQVPIFYIYIYNYIYPLGSMFILFLFWVLIDFEASTQNNM